MSRVSRWVTRALTLPKNSPGMCSIWRPRKSLIWARKITTAMPLVKPITTVLGMKRIRLPMRKTPIATSMAPASMVATSRFCTP